MKELNVELNLEVQGMTCAHCEKAIINALSDLGVKTVKASAKKNSVKIVFSPETTNPEAIKSEIKEMGYYV